MSFRCFGTITSAIVTDIQYTLSKISQNRSKYPVDPTMKGLSNQPILKVFGDVVLQREAPRLRPPRPQVVDDDAHLAPRQAQVAHAPLVAQVRGNHRVRALGDRVLWK